MSLNAEALEYHVRGRHGKIEVTPTKPCITQRDLSLAYTPGVAAPCLEIEKNHDDVFRYTARGNLVAVISNGTAVLGLGNIGALASKPVMEGKGVLFKRFADVDVFDIEIDTEDPDLFVETVKLLEPTFGGINLEDIKAPECFHIEDRLKKETEIPIFHDDQHGTAIISGAGFMNAVELVGKDIDKVKVVFSGAGASGIACAKIYCALGVRKENLTLCDSRGVVYKGRDVGMNPYKEEFAQDTKNRTLADAIEGADAFIGVSVKGILSKEMVKTMAKNPIIFAMANPDPEITYEDAKEACPDAIVATGRSDYPNQVNNVLGFPFIFRGALDVRAKAINEEMKIAASHALAKLAKEDVPDSVRRAYGGEAIKFGKDYIIPKPFDSRVLLWEAAAVAQAAMDTGVARIQLDMDEYHDRLIGLLSKSQALMSVVERRAVKHPKTVVFPEGESEKIIRASKLLADEKAAKPILIGNPKVINEKLQQLGLSAEDIEVIQPQRYEKFDEYCEDFYSLRCRHGITHDEAREFMLKNNHFASMMVHKGEADCLISGVTQYYPESIRPALKIIGPRKAGGRVAAAHVMVLKNQVYFFADTSVIIEPTEEDLVEIAILTAELARSFQISPRVAILSFSNFGSVVHPLAKKAQKATELVKKRDPDLEIDGEMHVETALLPEVQSFFPCCELKGPANVLIFPDLQSANIGYKLIQTVAGAEVIGPILMGMRKPAHILIRGSDVRDIVNLAIIGSVQAIENDANHKD
ncbi:MAG: NADP-dependent malic enzyme [Candidatus Latescibacteria bacterium]|nr:NADP-dependent malic enzyme [Candidatus Latescibacterota bacterium]NIM64511.1 NADP-dependent malic enzyme [Candidatus Latescibacterota bacterium]NIO00664.1 NADP-dependent malic enzyme [Candidatus Latescibacterota bacterium]NIO27067.1 NADP-dependent malic enzyme [Candidatus Latescibacterota bacterium]NIO54591.1 NADP-dependent malic enzyme [Candidatus Latescibacterota bacterium]